MANSGVSIKFIITNQNLQLNETGVMKRYAYNGLAAPTINAFGGQASYAITKWINPYPDIAFEKISLPQWGNSNAQNAYLYSTNISNQPDYIKDYHFIALMRCIDFYIEPKFLGMIKATTTGVKPS